MSLFPDIEPYQYHYLPVSGGHELYIEEIGNPSGIPILFLHGGPGGRSWPWDRRLFNPEKYRAILYHQRGCGWSKPAGSLYANTTAHLLSDIETIREHLRIKSWHLFGGSWGSTLALKYAQQNPKQTKSLILRGVFLGRPEDINWLYQSGAHWHSPQYYEAFSGFIPENERQNLVAAYYKRLCESEQPDIQAEAAKHWFNWEGVLSTLLPPESDVSIHVPEQEILNVARLEAHYFYHQSFLTAETAILNPKQLEKLSTISIQIVQGRYDMVCPPLGAWLVKRALPDHTELHIIPNAGHSQDEPELLEKTLKILENLPA